VDRKIRQKSKPLGFTMVELVILLAIVAILSGFAISEIMSYIEKARLRQALNQVLSDLNYVKNQPQITGVAWGIRACNGTGKYKIFLDYDGNCRDSRPDCDNINGTKICVNDPSQNCNSDSDCPGNFTGICRTLEQLKVLEGGFLFVKENTTSRSFYVVFDRKGLPFDYSCGIGADNVTIQSPSGKEASTIFVDRFGRVRVEYGKK
jgi:type II secretory pathway pseudopilin PulG